METDLKIEFKFSELFWNIELLYNWTNTMNLFGTDGVRGEAGSFLTAAMAMRIAMAAGIYFKKWVAGACGNRHKAPGY